MAQTPREYKNISSDTAEPNNRVTQKIVDKCNAVLKGSGICTFIGMTLEQNINWLRNHVEKSEKELEKMQRNLPKQRKALKALEGLWEKRYGKPYLGPGKENGNGTNRKG